MATHFPRLQKAILYSAQQHQGQDREGEAPLPYFAHPVEVLLNLRYVGKCTDEDMLCAAALHDVIEESGADLKEIEKLCGARTAALVRELTRREPTEAETKGMSKEEVWQLRAQMLLDEIAKMSADAQQIKLADRLSNVVEAYRTKQEKKLDRYLWQTRRILEIVPREISPGLWDAIEQAMVSDS